MMMLKKRLGVSKCVTPIPEKSETSSMLFSQLLAYWHKIFSNYLWNEFLWRNQVREGLHVLRAD
jgi:hypothetical protein